MTDVTPRGEAGPFRDGRAERFLLADTFRGRALQCRDRGRVQVRFGLGEVPELRQLLRRACSALEE